MARSRSNGSHDRLDEAMALLINNQAAFVAQLRENDRLRAELKRESDERFARIESLLLEHNRILTALPDAIRDKIGFKGAASTN
jgi:hypothetical protein